MKSRRIFVGLDPALVGFMDHYAAKHSHKSRSRVVSDALMLLQTDEQAQLEAAYAASASADLCTDRALACLTNDGLRETHW